MLYTMPKALLLHQDSDNHPPAIIVDALYTLSLSVVLNRETNKTEVRIVIIMTVATIDLEAETETILDLTIEVDHETETILDLTIEVDRETEIDPEAVTTILKTEVTLKSKI